MNLHTFQRLVRAGKTGLFLLGLVTAGMAYASGDAAVAEAAAGVAKAPVDPAIFYAIAVTMSVGSLSAGFAVGKVGAAAMGAAAEKPELLGKAIAFVGLGEGIALFGFLVSLFLVFKI
ncbi:ATP synthase subunit C [Oligosphaera ethanolica]|jgi:V/A-type H+-transporting ATPase subunit K|uniref:V/A-type H+-transporting ATPase subunit K n=1 Tax=Oligosphaera ethanolica TaxID=760260 RepID=A0AAE3VFX5_9BACT|nr:ATP synthase subunit C [Oligosphaera ethanolica]MDD4538417.1 ATP synthase subunit C [Lentisphaeria bacterium]MDQ0289758.1 V/A-type H+-transporting ATPase subunit K [Oligosphaera ethanolica]HPY91438.1 ATP synthase subunit C [Lentisphaeria bacterium]HQL09105.1 ATP synthase subunit C [Lentisphaeria bacterium]